MASFENQNILVISNEPWQGVWYSKHNYAYEMSKKNKVIFINPSSKWSLKNLFSFKVKEDIVSDSLSSLSYGNIFPSSPFILNRLNNFFVSLKLKNWLYNQKKISHPIFYSFDPIRLYNPKLFNSKFSVYHCVDNYALKFKGEKIICKKADYLFSTSSHFIENYKDFNIKKELIPHGISSEEFVLNDTQLETIENELKDLNITKFRFGLFIGVVDFRLDFDFIEKLLIDFPEQEFVFIGPLKLPQKNQAAQNIFVKLNYSNARIIGARDFKTLKYYIYLSKFCFSFMDMSYLGNIFHHHKTLVFLTQGKPVFSSLFKEYESLHDIMYMSNDYSEMKSMLNNFIQNEETPDKTEKRINYAKSYTFENILDKIDKIYNSYTSK